MCLWGSAPTLPALLSVSREGRGLKLDSGILCVPASIQQCGERSCHKARARRGLDVSLQPP